MGRPRKLTASKASEVIIKNGGAFTLNWLAKTTGVCQATARKTVHELQDMHYPIYVDVPHGYIYVGNMEDNEKYVASMWRNDAWRVGLVQGIKRESLVVNEEIAKNERKLLGEVPMYDVRLITLTQPDMFDEAATQ